MKRNIVDNHLGKFAEHVKSMLYPLRRVYVLRECDEKDAICRLAGRSSYHVHYLNTMEIGISHSHPWTSKITQIHEAWWRLYPLLDSFVHLVVLGRRVTNLDVMYMAKHNFGFITRTEDFDLPPVVPTPVLVDNIDPKAQTVFTGLTHYVRQVTNFFRLQGLVDYQVTFESMRLKVLEESATKQISGDGFTDLDGKLIDISGHLTNFMLLEMGIVMLGEKPLLDTYLEQLWTNVIQLRIPASRNTQLSMTELGSYKESNVVWHTRTDYLLAIPNAMIWADRIGIPEEVQLEIYEKVTISINKLAISERRWFKAITIKDVDRTNAFLSLAEP
jgi:hypothetical protein